MCGIVFVLHSAASRKQVATIDTSQVSQRGPDSHGEFHDSLVDLHVFVLSMRFNSTSKQPFFIDDDLVMGFNGEAYFDDETENRDDVRAVGKLLKFKSLGTREAVGVNVRLNYELIKANEVDMRLNHALTKANEVDVQSDYALTKANEVDMRLNPASKKANEVDVQSDDALTKANEVDMRLNHALTKADEVDVQSDYSLTKADDVVVPSDCEFVEANEVDARSIYDLTKANSAEKVDVQSGVSFAPKDVYDDDLRKANGDLPFVDGRSVDHEVYLKGDTCQSIVQSHQSRCKQDWNAMVQLLDDKIEGEWTLVCYSRRDASVVVARDGFGRKSLLWKKMGDAIVFASTCCGDANEWEEVPVDCFWMLSWKNGTWIKDAIPRSSRVLGTVLDLKGFNGSEVLRDALMEAIKRRIDSNTLGLVKRFTIMFSGGLDSVVIAALAHLVCAQDECRRDEVIHLVNVSFDPNSPDRVAARLALSELTQLYPLRKWSLLEINPTFEEVVSDEASILQHIYPKSTVMDFNIACVFWFASKHSVTRALLSGTGADELLGGYGRHRTAAAKDGVEAFKKELRLDLNRMWTRNLGRDDRIVSAHGKEMRAPFLDKLVVQSILSLPISELLPNLNGTLDRDERLQDKFPLRELARKLGLQGTADREKRAAQFGSRMSKFYGGAGRNESGASNFAQSRVKPSEE